MSSAIGMIVLSSLRRHAVGVQRSTENCYPSHALTHCTKQKQAQMSSKIKILWHVHTYLGRVIIFLPGLQFMGISETQQRLKCRDTGGHI